MNNVSKRRAFGAVAGFSAIALALGTALPAQAADSELKIGAIIPLTGSLSFLSPPEIAGLHMAVDEINAAGGVLGKKVSLSIQDSGDGTTLNIADQSATKALASKVDVVIGAAASGVTRHIINKITGAKVVQISMSNTAPDLSTWKDGGYYFRTAPSDLLQGKIIANQILQDASKNVAIVYVDNSYGNGLMGVAKTTLEKGKAKVTTFSFKEADTNPASTVDAALATDPDAVLLISYDEAKRVVPLFKSKGFNGSNIYFVDGNLADYSKESFAGYLNGAKGTLPGKALSAGFKSKTGKTLTEFSYGAETYDAVLLAAIAAQSAKDASGVGIKKEITNISLSGAGKTTVSTFKAALAALKAGKKVNYDGVSGPVEFDKNGDPTGAFIGIYRFNSKGTYSDNLIKVVAGNTVK
jgi:branched-chain amino acid transport system substrate-binding protein